MLPATIVAPRTDPIYNCHQYLTKVPIAAIQPFIEACTQPGEIVADFFAGSGMTGLAALTLNRRARLSDISVLGQHIAHGYLTNLPEATLREAGVQVVEQARTAIGTLYTTKRNSDGHRLQLVRTVWSFCYRCPKCDLEIVYFEQLDEQGNPPRTCPSCGANFARRSWQRSDDMPVRVVVHGADGRQVEQNVSSLDWENIAAACRDSRLSDVPSLKIEPHREMYGRSGLAKSGMTETARFFSARNAIALLELWTAIKRIKDSEIRQKLSFAFTAILPRASKRYQWSRKRPLNAQNQTYYIAPVYYEWNVFDLYKRKLSSVIRANDVLFGRQPMLNGFSLQDVTYHKGSAARLSHIQTESIDYVFTDPPFGSNIFYSDMNLFQEAWLGRVTDNTSEAVVHTTGKKKNGAMERYKGLLRDSFKEAYRVLRPGRHMSVVFGNSSGRIWGLVQRALRDAGFKPTPVHVAILDKGQRSIKGLNSGSEGVVILDLVLTVQKPNVGEELNAAAFRSVETGALVHRVIQNHPTLDEQSPSLLYVEIVRTAIKEGLILDNFHLGDVLVALRNAGCSIDQTTGLISCKKG
ncbi:MAG: DNA methyltransferase [Spirochaetaceae bacterium]|nr:DNA methyltransferase [Spirochaetaceae bacterium]